MKKSINIYIICGLILFAVSCSKDNGRSCTICSSAETSDFEICRESDGSASVNGENTGTDYDVYVDGLVATGAMCGGI